MWLSLLPSPSQSPLRTGWNTPHSRTQRRRSGTAANAVAVDVSVTESGRTHRPITGLAASDFQVFDNGVPQQVDEVSYGKLPIDVTVALDVSHSVTGRLLDRLRHGVVQLIRDLGKEDRLKLVLFNMRVMRTLDFSRDVKAVEQVIRTAGAGGGTALLDAISVALVSASVPDWRQLIVVFTDGSDSTSTTSPAMLAGVAQRTRPTLTFVLPFANRRTTTDYRGRIVSLASTGGVSLTRIPLYGLFSTLTRETRGSLLPVGHASDLSATFRRILNEFRSPMSCTTRRAASIDRGTTPLK